MESSVSCRQGIEAYNIVQLYGREPRFLQIWPAQNPGPAAMSVCASQVGLEPQEPTPLAANGLVLPPLFLYIAQP
jgi:hypothetical protein